MSGLDSEMNTFNGVLPHKLIRMLLAMDARESVQCTIFVFLTVKRENRDNHWSLYENQLLNVF